MIGGKVFIPVAYFLLFSLKCTSVRYDEKYYVSNFEKDKGSLDQIVNYVDQKYIQTTDRSDHSRKTILFCGNRNIFTSSDYRFCDSILELKMRDHNIAVISIEKNVCFSDRNFDLITFEMSQNSRMSYQYSFCNAYNSLIENGNMKTIPLDKKWSLFIDKN